ncbi:MAG TPA: ABC transporter permease [Microthrixaceae bacterium]|nr:ABC transporter permease [Microthrixaceae bacterium]
MIHAAFRDLLWRRRRYLISMMGCGLVFGMSLLMSGLSSAFGVELDNTIDSLGAERGFVMPSGLGGPFSGSTPFSVDSLPAGATPVMYLPQRAIGGGGDGVVMSVFGVPRGSGSEPSVIDGRSLERAGEVLVADRSTLATGSTVEIGGASYEVVGRVGPMSLFGGNLGVVMDLPEFQDQFLGGAPLVTAGVIDEGFEGAPSGFQVVSPTEAREDGLAALGSATQSISFITGLLWGVAALIIASVVFLSALERTRDFAVFKATGTSTSAMAAGLAMQAVILALAAALFGVGLGLVLAPTFPMPVEVAGSSVGLLLVVALVVGLFASLFGLRRAVSVEPALAFGGAT